MWKHGHAVVTHLGFSIDKYSFIQKKRFKVIAYQKAQLTIAAMLNLQMEERFYLS